MARVEQRRAGPDPATYVGKGKAEEIRRTAEALDCDTVVFDDELTPAQQRNLEKLLGRTAIDRTAVILDIFAQNASSQEGKAQVELALLRYRLPRLRGRGKGLSQQAGGASAAGGARIGPRGPGETQLETDRRRIVRRIHRLEGQLSDVRRLWPRNGTIRSGSGWPRRPSRRSNTDLMLEPEVEVRSWAEQVALDDEKLRQQLAYLREALGLHPREARGRADAVGLAEIAQLPPHAAGGAQSDAQRRRQPVRRAPLRGPRRDRAHLFDERHHRHAELHPADGERPRQLG